MEWVSLELLFQWANHSEFVQPQKSPCEVIRAGFSQRLPWVVMSHEEKEMDSPVFLLSPFRMQRHGFAWFCL
jgi:hypothetical protein